MEFIEVAQCYEDGFLHHEVVDGDQSYLEKKKPFSDPATVSDNCDRNGSFDCNICLDDARDPVVTLCGHLYCWPCIFKWLHSQPESGALDEHQQQQCPVCKADISDTAVVPLYGRDGHAQGRGDRNGKDSSELEIPRRPLAHDVHSLRATSPDQPLHNRSDNLSSGFQPDQYQQYYSATSPIFNLGGPTTHPMMLMFGEMVQARVFGSLTGVNFMGYPNSYNHITGSSPRVRRQQMRAERSLNRVSIFLFCCIFLCLVLF